MLRRKVIYWRPDLPKNDQGELKANVHVIGNYAESLQEFQKLASEIRETFPQATIEEITCNKISESGIVKKHSLVTWTAYIPAGDYPGWDQVEDGRMEYYWI